MIPKSVSATALHVWQLCPARWYAENYLRPPQMGNSAADVGTAFHGGAELFVKYIMDGGEWKWEQLRAYFIISFVQTFGHSDETTPEFEDGMQLTRKWFLRSEYLKDTDVISCEVKKNFMIPAVHNGEKIQIPFNYICDRIDRTGEHEIRVVDYKTIRVPLNQEQMRKKIQPRAYALAMQIEYPDSDEIWVEYDMIRHDRVGLLFTREDQILTWKYLKAEVQRIVDTAEDEVEERLNPECRWCIRKAECETLQSSISAGSILGVSPDEASRIKLDIKSKIDALNNLDAELDMVLIKEAEDRDVIEWDTPFAHVNITASKRRKANSNAISNILGPELMSKWGNITVTNVDKLLRSGELTDEQIQQVKNQIAVNWGEPTPKVVPLTPFDGE